jgi:pimeloyl-ACP methyl ester carboxylesterase
VIPGGLTLPAHAATIRWHRVGPAQPTLVCLPALCMSARRSFAPMLAHLPGCGALLPDYLGSGDSDAPERFDFTPAAHAGTIAAVMDHLGLGPCPVYGHSMGGSVAIALALSRPDLVSRLIVGEGNIAPGGGAATRRIAAFSEEEFLATGLDQTLARLRAGAAEGRVILAALADAFESADPRALYGAARGLVDLPEDFGARFLALDLPRTFVYGALSHPDATGEVTPDTPDPATLAAAGVEIAVLPGADHALQLADPAGFAALLAGILGHP